MMSPSSQSVDEAYALIGKVAVGFSTIEFHLQFLLSLLLTGKEGSAEAVILFGQKQFSQRIRLLKDLVILKFDEGSRLGHEGIELVNSLEALRVTRNRYVHGYWLVNRHLLVSSGGVRCSETKWHFDKSDQAWKSMQPIDIPLDELRRQIAETQTVFERIHGAIAEIKKENSVSPSSITPGKT